MLMREYQEEYGHVVRKYGGDHRRSRLGGYVVWYVVYVVRVLRVSRVGVDDVNGAKIGVLKVPSVVC